ncbi:hypothetical protein [Helicobacter fennelliae]|nr:hypothetical protein [Helicobacter fennelliae]STP14457.1 Uncharacterised protein [Helicobacter fennelliae]
MKYFVLLVLLCIFCINTNADDRFDVRKNLKHYGFGFCLQKSYGYVEKGGEMSTLSYHLHIFQRGSMKFSVMAGLKNEEQVAKIIQSYVSQFMSSPQREATTKQGFRVLVQDCMQLYDSKEYQAEVERIVKKYCKDCQ